MRSNRSGRPAQAGALAREDGTLRQLVDALPAFGDDPAVLTFVGTGRSRLSYRALSDWIGRLTASLIDRGVGRGTRVAILAPNCPEWIALCLSVINAGGTVVPIDSKLDQESLKHVLGDSAPEIAFVPGDDRDRIERLAREGLTLIPIEEAADAGSDDAMGRTTPSLPGLAANEPAVIFYTSGTTGPPKGVPLSHGNLLFQLRSLLEFGLLERGERLLLPLPLHHVYPFVVGMLAPLLYGVGIVLPQSLTGPNIMQAVDIFDVATIIGVPRLYGALVSGIEERIASGGRLAAVAYRVGMRIGLFARRRLALRLGAVLFHPLRRRIGPRLRLLASGGAALDPQLAWTLDGLGWTLATGYGLTETSPMLTILPPGTTRFDTVGRPIAGVEMRIAPLATEEEETGPEGEEEARDIGEIQVRGAGVFDGYRNLPDRTAEAFTDDGWFRTEDRGFIEDDGYVHVLGRSAVFVVTQAGENISLEALEAAYEEAPQIREIGIFMEDGTLCAVVVPDMKVLREADAEEGPETATRDVVHDRSMRLPTYKRIGDMVVSRDALERTRLGKIRRNKLPERFHAIRRRRDKGEKERGPVPIEEMSGEDQALLEHPKAAEVWKFLAAKFSTAHLGPDSDVALDLGIDSLEWINLTLEIRARTGIELSEPATARIETVRDLLEELLAAGEEHGDGEKSLEDDPERYLDKDQKRWLKPLNRVETALAWLLYHLNRVLVRSLFRLEVAGLEHVPRDGVFVLTPNHTSVLDPFVIAAAMPYGVLRQCCFAGWTGIAFANPLFRFVVRLARTVPIEQHRAAFSSMALALVMLRGGTNIIWFAEGQRSEDGRLRKFMPGIGVLLAKHSVPVVPAIVSGTFEAMPRGRRIPRLRRVTVRFGRAYRPEDLEENGEGDSPEARMTDGLHREMERLQRGRDA